MDDSLRQQSRRSGSACLRSPRQPADPRWFSRPWFRGRAPDGSQNTLRTGFDAARGRQVHRQRCSAMALVGEVRLVGEAGFGALAGGDDQERGEVLVVALVGARGAIAVVGVQLGRVVARAFGPAVVLE